MRELVICNNKERCKKLGYLTRGKDLKRKRSASAQRQRVDEETETQKISPKQVSLLSFNAVSLYFLVTLSATLIKHIRYITYDIVSCTFGQLLLKLPQQPKSHGFRRVFNSKNVWQKRSIKFFNLQKIETSGRLIFVQNHCFCLNNIFKTPAAGWLEISSELIRWGVLIVIARYNDCQVNFRTHD